MMRIIVVIATVAFFALLYQELQTVGDDDQASTYLVKNNNINSCSTH
jgi:hypothetical protein